MNKFIQMLKGNGKNVGELEEKLEEAVNGLDIKTGKKIVKSDFDDLSIGSNSDIDSMFNQDEVSSKERETIKKDIKADSIDTDTNVDVNIEGDFLTATKYDSQRVNEDFFSMIEDKSEIIDPDNESNNKKDDEKSINGMDGAVIDLDEKRNKRIKVIIGLLLVISLSGLGIYQYLPSIVNSDIYKNVMGGESKNQNTTAIKATSLADANKESDKTVEGSGSTKEDINFNTGSALNLTGSVGQGNELVTTNQINSNLTDSEKNTNVNTEVNTNITPATKSDNKNSNISNSSSSTVKKTITIDDSNNKNRSLLSLFTLLESNSVSTVKELDKNFSQDILSVVFQGNSIKVLFKTNHNSFKKILDEGNIDSYSSGNTVIINTKNK